MGSLIKPSLSYLYYAVRTLTLPISIFFIILWIIYGYDSTIETIIVGYYGVGIHLSTFATFFFTVYVLTLNLQVGPLTLNSFRKYLIFDLKNSFGLHKNRDKYRIYQGIEPLRGIAFAVAVSVMSAFIFEIPYIFLLNYLHFGDLFWPIYYNSTNLFIGILSRNFIMLFVPLFFSWWIMFYRRDLRIKYNFNKKTLALLIITLISWAFWIYYPQNGEVTTPESLDLDLDKNWTFPEQKMFLQTVNVYFDAPKMSVYNQTNLFHWYEENNVVHTLNILTKTLTFILVGYIYLVKIEIWNPYD